MFLFVVHKLIVFSSVNVFVKSLYLNGLSGEYSLNLLQPKLMKLILVLHISHQMLIYMEIGTVCVVIVLTLMSLKLIVSETYFQS